MHQPRPNTRASTSKQQGNATGAGPGDRDASPHGDSNPSNADLQRDIAKFTATISQKIDKMNELLDTKIDNLNKQISDLNERFTQMEKSQDFNDAQISEVKKEIPKVRGAMESEMEKLNEKITLLEIYNRKANLLFYGVQEQQNENVCETLRKVFGDLGIDEGRAGSIKFANAHRLPARQDFLGREEEPQRQSRPSPIIAKFLSMMDRDYVLSTFEQLQFRRHQRASPDQQGPTPSRVTVRTDLPRALKIRRGILAQAAYKLRKEKGLSTRIKLQGAKLILQSKEKGTTTWKLVEE